GRLIIVDLESQNGAASTAVRVRGFHRTVGIDRAAVMQCVATIIFVPDPDIAALYPHVDRQLAGVAVPADQGLRAPAIWLGNKRTLVKPVKGSVRRWGWRRRRWGWRCRGNRGWRRGGGRGRRLRSASGNREKQAEHDQAFHPLLL